MHKRSGWERHSKIPIFRCDWCVSDVWGEEAWDGAAKHSFQSQLASRSLRVGGGRGAQEETSVGSGDLQCNHRPEAKAAGACAAARRVLPLHHRRSRATSALPQSRGATAHPPQPLTAAQDLLMQLERCLGMDETSVGSDCDVRRRLEWEKQIESRMDNLRKEQIAEASHAREWTKMLEELEEEKLVLCRNIEVRDSLPPSLLLSFHPSIPPSLRSSHFL
eukprot:594826-Hanusia_phi.AAC.1